RPIVAEVMVECATIQLAALSLVFGPSRTGAVQPRLDAGNAIGDGAKLGRQTLIGRSAMLFDGRAKLFDGLRGRDKLVAVIFVTGFDRLGRPDFEILSHVNFLSATRRRGEPPGRMPLCWPAWPHSERSSPAPSTRRAG